MNIEQYYMNWDEA